MATAAICNMVAAILHILQEGLDAINLLLGPCLAVFLFSDVIIVAKPRKPSLRVQNGYGVKLHNDPKED